MIWIALLVVLVLLAMVVAAAGRNKQGVKTPSTPYTKKVSLFTPAERSFLGVLDQAVGDQYRIFAKTRVADIIGVKSTSDRSAWSKAFNQIKAKHFDFVLCSKDTLEVIAAIELNDKSHQKKKRQERDAFLAGVCQDISLPFFEIPAQRSYSATDLREKLSAVLDPQETNLPQTPDGDNVAKTGPCPVEPGQPEEETLPNSSGTTGDSAPICPKCEGKMVLRKYKKGAKAGQEFWGCSNFPKCRSILPR